MTVFWIISHAKDLWDSPQISAQCIYNVHGASEAPPNKFYGGIGGNPIYATGQGRIYAIISWGISQELPELNIDYDAIGNLQFKSDMQYMNPIFGADSVNSCSPFTLHDRDHIYGFRIIYREFIHGLYFHTKNGSSYQCVANVSKYTYNQLNDTGDIYVNNSYLSGFRMRTGGVIDAIELHFTTCVWPTSEPTSNPTSQTIQPTASTHNPTAPPTFSPTTNPTNIPTYTPTKAPSNAPSNSPSWSPNFSPSLAPSDFPTATPTLSPTMFSIAPTFTPTMQPSELTIQPTTQPSVEPTNSPKIQATISTSNRLSTEAMVVIVVIVSIVSIVSMILCCIWCRRYRDQKANVCKVDKALVLIIAISSFDDEKYIGWNVEANVNSLMSLWRDSFNYDVFLCEETTKCGIIDFVDEHVTTLRTDSSYKAVIVHILSIGISEKLFITSDGKRFDIGMIYHELTDALYLSDIRALVKIIFYDAKENQNKIDKNFADDERKEEMKSFTDNEEKKSLCEVEMTQLSNCNDVAVPLRCTSISRKQTNPNLNYVTIYSLKTKNGEFTECICEVLRTGRNKYFCSLIQEVKTSLKEKTDNEQTCTSIDMVTLSNKVMFKRHGLLTC